MANGWAVAAWLCGWVRPTWPAQRASWPCGCGLNHYTRITKDLNLTSALVAHTQLVEDPPRLAVDIEGIHLVPALKELVGRVKSDDPNIAGLRVAQHKPNLVRLVVDMKNPSARRCSRCPP